MEKENRFRFYESPLLLWSLLFIMPPLGIFILWLFKFYNTYLRISITLLFGLLFLNFLGLESSFVRSILLMLIITLLWLRTIDINKHKDAAKLYYNELKDHLTLEETLKNYMKEYDSPTESYLEIKYFEEELVKDYPILNEKPTLGNIEEIYIQTIFHKLDDVVLSTDINQEAINKYKSDFNKLVKVILKNYQIESDKLCHYIVWELLKSTSIDYYSNVFLNLHGESFKQLSTLKDAVIKYIHLKNLNLDIQSKERALFTYFMMKFGELKNESDFVKCSNQIEEEIKKQMKIKSDKEFEDSLKTRFIVDVKEINGNVSTN